MTDDWDRRRFLSRLGLATLGLAGSSGVALLAHQREHETVLPRAAGQQVRDFRAGLARPPVDFVVSRGAPAQATAAAIATLGGMGLFVKPGERVVIKPNVGWDRTPLQAANTNPIVVATLVRLCREAGAREVIVTDMPCNEPKRCFTRSGIWQAVEEAGGVIVLPAEHRFRTFDLGGVILGQMPVLEPALDADRFINVPIAKHHGLSKFTGAMKNLYGVLGGRRNRLHQRIDDSIADLADFLRPTLTVMDATRVLLRNGPQGGDLADTREIGEIIASVDQVAVDAYSVRHLGLTPADVPYLALAQRRGLGTTDLTKLSRREVG